MYRKGADPDTKAWWINLSEEERRLAQEEARRYEALSEEEQDAIWSEGAESIEADTSD